MRRPSLLLLALLLTLSACSSLPTAEESGGAGVYTVTLEQAAQRIADVEDLVIIDLRTPEEFAGGHVEGATMINFYDDDFDEQVAALDRDAAYLIYCSKGGRSGSAGGVLTELAFTDVADMTEGFAAWAAGGYPVAS